MKGLLQRVITAIFFGAVMLGGLFGGPYPFALLFALVTILCLWEFLGLCLPAAADPANGSRRIIGTVLGSLPYGLVSLQQLDLFDQPDLMTTALLCFIPLVFLVFLYELFHQAEKPFANVAYIVLGIVYLGCPFALLFLIAMKGGNYSPNIVLGMLLLTWANDTGAYFVGSKLGKTPLFPRISPKKTWEGSMGGVVIGLLVAWLLSWFFPLYSTLEWLGLALVVVVFGALGDLVESMLKRSLKIKDSGNILPGHGGMLDRFDAFIFVIPFVMAYLLFIQ
ncbi:MAG: phosphatidate cytidylyltransferase [Bacteroidota bacterium]